MSIKNDTPVAVIVPDEATLGPAMLRLTERQRKFVMAMIELGGMGHARAAISAGYSYNPDKPNKIEVQAHSLAHDEKIQDAIKEVGIRMLNAGAILAVKTVLDIADNPQAEMKDRLKAAEMIMNRSGLHAMTEHKATVVHKSESTSDTVKRIEQMAKKLGLDPAKLLGNCVIEGSFEEVPEDDLGDIY